jgi:hypothetical protein
MIVNLVRHVGDNIVLERIDGNLLFEGGAAQEGVLATFQLDDRELTGRVINVVEEPDEETVVEIELIDQAAQDAEGEITRANLPPDDDTGTRI